MAFNFNFRTVDKTADLRTLVDFLMKQSLNYPQYEDWVLRAEKEIEQGHKIPIMALDGSTLVGNLIYQPHKEVSRLREIKNLRVHPELRGRAFAYFMLKQAEVERAEDYDAIMVDARKEQKDILGLLMHCGYTPIGETSLYNANDVDVIMVKTINQRTATGIMYQAKNLLTSNF